MQILQYQNLDLIFELNFINLVEFWFIACFIESVLIWLQCYYKIIKTNKHSPYAGKGYGNKFSPHSTLTN